MVKVSDREISTKERSTGQTVIIPYGMCVWATGIGSRPVVMDFMKQIGQVCSILVLLHFLLIFSCFSTNSRSYQSVFVDGLQTNRRILATDEWLRVEGCKDIYALGDCATVNQRSVMVKLYSDFDFLY